MTTATRIAIRTVKVWLNAFIPKNVDSLTEPAPSSHPGKTMLRGPIPGISDCYLTDNRGFDSDVMAVSRMCSKIEIDVTGPTIISQMHKCDTTHEIDCEDGDAECTKSGDTSRMSFSNLRSSSGLIQVDLKAAANNPCQSGSPDIDYEGTITINVGARTVEFDGKIDEFPAFEMYASINGDTVGKIIFQEMPLSGKTPWNLPGGANRAIKKSVII
jgi:hypothetical protein